MTKSEIGLYALLIGVLIHTAGNAKKLYDQVNAKATPSTTDYVYYLATLALVVGTILLWKKIK